MARGDGMLDARQRNLTGAADVEDIHGTPLVLTGGRVMHPAANDKPTRMLVRRLAIERLAQHIGELLLPERL